MSPRKCLSLAVLIFSLILSSTSAAQRIAPASLRKLATRSGMIFSGTVTDVKRAAATPGTVATVRVTFHVDQAVRGVRAHQPLTIREWAGLWNEGERYRVGQRVFLFLYPNSKLGLTSPASGDAGQFHIDDKGNVRPIADDPRVTRPVAVKIAEFTRMVRKVAKE